MTYFIKQSNYSESVWPYKKSKFWVNLRFLKVSEYPELSWMSWVCGVNSAIQITVLENIIWYVYKVYFKIIVRTKKIYQNLSRNFNYPKFRKNKKDPS